MSESTHSPASPSDMTIVQQETSGNNSPGTGMLSTEDVDLVEMLRSGDEAAFVSLIDRYHTSMLRLAQVYVPAQSVAEEVVQEAWMGVLQGLKRFEGRSSLKTWIFRILTNCAKTRALREGRSIPFSSLPDFDTKSNMPVVGLDRFLPPDDPVAPGGWASLPCSWENIPEDRLLSQETRMRIETAVMALPPNQRAVITLRDIEGWSAEETCHFLGISEANQRVLLHRARAKVRQALEKYFEEE